MELEIEGEAEAVESFLRTVRNNPPPLARITGLEVDPRPLNHDHQFRILPSLVQEDRSALISPDIATCQECLKELQDPGDRRYHYPFINCTNCGPRYTIIQDIPYDRAKTTMAAFTMCSECAEEYHSPLSRRFHAQPNACPKCGPQVFLHDEQGVLMDVPDPIGETVRLLQLGRIAAIKGLGGFHLAVDAGQEEAVRRLRARKHREEKPLALMSRDLEIISSYALASREEKEILESKERPIVLLSKKHPNLIASFGGPRQSIFRGHAALHPGPSSLVGV